MNSDPWRGSNIPTYPRVLILGESHYDDNKGEKVSYPTSGVVRTYFESRHRWSQFFDKIAASFGYDRDKARQFYEKVYFGNYIDVVCSVGDDSASHYADLNRDTYNAEWFDFINRNEIDVVVCFSKMVFSHFPSLNEMGKNENSGREYVGDIGGRSNYVEYRMYAPYTEHEHCSIELTKPLKVYGIRHPSGQGGYAPNQICKYVTKQEDLRQICFDNTKRDMVRMPEIFLVKANTICTMFLNEHNDVINSKELTDSYYQYVRAFCLMVVLHCKHYSNVDYMNLVNHITMPALDSITDEDYCIAIDDSKLSIYETYLLSDHGIIYALQKYDKCHEASSMEAFLRMLSMLSVIFVEIDKNNCSIVNNDVPELLKNIRNKALANRRNLTTDAQNRAPSIKKNDETANVQKNNIKINEVDAFFFVRIIIPVLAIVFLGVVAFKEDQLWAFFATIIPVCFLISGIKENGKRCPQCRAWHSMYISQQKLIKQEKVKVRRPLQSVYFRTSGRATFGVRQTFVSADEYTYNTTVRCRVCGYESEGFRTVIDDKIR